VVKRSFMVQLWRIQQSYTLLSLLIWGVLITFTAWPILSPVWQDILIRFGVPLSTPGAVAAGLLVIFFGVYVVLYTFGVVYDKYLKLWREQLDVTYERNPYTREKLMVKEILMSSKWPPRPTLPRRRKSSSSRSGLALSSPPTQ